MCRELGLDDGESTSFDQDTTAVAFICEVANRYIQNFDLTSYRFSPELRILFFVHPEEKVEFEVRPTGDMTHTVKRSSSDSERFDVKFTRPLECRAIRLKDVTSTVDVNGLTYTRTEVERTESEWRECHPQTFTLSFCTYEVNLVTGR